MKKTTEPPPETPSKNKPEDGGGNNSQEKEWVAGDGMLTSTESGAQVKRMLQEAIEKSHDMLLSIGPVSLNETNGSSTLGSVTAHQNGATLISWRERLEEFLFGWDLKRYKSYPIVALEKNSLAAEQYGILREKIKRRCAETKAHCLSVMSPVKGDGKTLVAVNLAVAIALSSREQVVLIDGDIRDPQIHRYFNIKSRPGLTDYLSSHSSEEVLSSYFQDTFLPNLKILAAGNPTDLSSELFSSPRMKNLIAEIRSGFKDHQIIIDTSPLLTTSDPLVLAEQVDGVILVARAGRTPHECVLEAIDSLGSNRVVGLILNDVELTAGNKYHYYYRRSPVLE